MDRIAIMALVIGIVVVGLVARWYVLMRLRA
jgi:hypothetical protein